MIDIKNFDSFFESSPFVSSEFAEKMKQQKDEVKRHFVLNFAKHFSLVTQDELNVYLKKISLMEDKIKQIEELLDNKK